MGIQGADYRFFCLNLCAIDKPYSPGFAMLYNPPVNLMPGKTLSPILGKYLIRGMSRAVGTAFQVPIIGKSHGNKEFGQPHPEFHGRRSIPGLADSE